MPGGKRAHSSRELSEGRGLTALDRSEAQDLENELKERERATRRHTIWALLGVSPAGLIPLVAAASDFGVAALLTGAVCITGIEAWRAHRAKKDATELRAKLDRLVSAEGSGSD